MALVVEDVDSTITAVAAINSMAPFLLLRLPSCWTFIILIVLLFIY